MIASQLASLRFEDKQKILELYDPVKRLREVLRLITKEIQVSQGREKDPHPRQRADGKIPKGILPQ